MSESNRGRPKGSRNKVTNAAKEAIQMAFDELGGVARLVAWVKEDKKNEFVFYTKIYPMLLPRPAPEPPPEPEAPSVMTGTLIWKAPNPEPCPPLAAPVDPAAWTDAAAVAAAATGGDLARATEEATCPP